MFRFKSLDVITLFHKSSVPASTRIRNVLKQASATATEPATQDKASDHTAQTRADRQPFELNITEDPPTPDQLRTILEYVGLPKVRSVVKGATDEADAVRKLKQNSENFIRPITVDWNNGRAILGDDVSAINKMLESLPKK